MPLPLKRNSPDSLSLSVSGVRERWGVGGGRGEGRVGGGRGGDCHFDSPHHQTLY